MPKLTPFLTFNADAEEAVRYYLSIFEDGKITSTMPGPDGKVMGLTFDLLGQTFQALNGGPSFVFSPAFSMFVSCDTQAEIDRYWSKLTDGGKEVQCGWLVDRFGVSWQIIPKRLPEMFGDKDRAKAERAIAAMMKMQKIDLPALEKAFNGY